MRLKINKSHSLEELIKGTRKGDSMAQRELFNRLSRRMLGICIRYVNNRAEAEDIMITGFMKVFNSIGQYKGEGSFEGWVMRIMINESLSYIRKNKTMWADVDIDKAVAKPDMKWADTHLNSEDLLKLINQLPTGYRTVFNLYAIEGFSHREIGEMLGINENTSKSQLSRARMYLQERIEDLEKKSKADEIRRI
ncbi:MAG TPA: RNA polymerase sigma factor [Cyclobacteriaceae bacterium]|nr:RNA polymerase sigma factor [Cyclobacteriaceae bacterium]